MSVFYYERKFLIISILLIIIDGIITYFIPSYYNDLNYLYPMLTISFIPFALINKKSSYFLIIIIGIIYDLLYSNVFLYNVILFIFLLNIDIKISKYFKNSLFLLIILALLNIILYDTISFILIILTSYSSVTFYDLIYKINHSIIINIMSVFVFWFMFKKEVHYHKM